MHTFTNVWILYVKFLSIWNCESDHQIKDGLRCRNQPCKKTVSLDQSLKKGPVYSIYFSFLDIYTNGGKTC